jgi:putative peptidoglycan lipid II flippase
MAQLHLKWRFPPMKAVAGLKEYTAMLWPAAFSTSIGQLTVYVDAFFALQEQAAWTAIVNSNRLVQLPLGILVTAMLVPMLPRFTQHVTEEKIDDLKDDLRQALRFMWFLALPMSAILLAIPLQIVQVLFMRGAFDEHSAALVTSALIFLVPSIFFYVARDLMTRVFYAYKDSQTPYRIAMIAIVVKGLLDWTFIQFMDRTAGISLATTVITIFNLSLLTWALKKKTGNLGFTKLGKSLSIMLFGTVICGLATFGAYFGLDHLYTANDNWIRLAYMAISSALGLLLYVATCMAFKLEEPVAVAKRLPVIRKFVK